MQFFSKDKDIIHRIINAVLIIWSLIGLVTTLYASYNIFNLNYDFGTYNSYKLNVCTMNQEKMQTQSELSEDACRDDYSMQRRSTERRAADNLILSLINLAIPAVTVLYINRPIHKKKT